MTDGPVTPDCHAGSAEPGMLEEHPAFARAVRALHRHVLPGEARDDPEGTSEAESSGMRCLHQRLASMTVLPCVVCPSSAHCDCMPSDAWLPASVPLGRHQLAKL